MRRNNLFRMFVSTGSWLFGVCPDGDGALVSREQTLTELFLKVSLSGSSWTKKTNKPQSLSDKTVQNTNRNGNQPTTP